MAAKPTEMSQIDLLITIPIRNASLFQQKANPLKKLIINMPLKYLTIAIISSVFLLSCDRSPTAPEDDLVGTWVLVKAREGSGVIDGVVVFRADGTLSLSLEAEGFFGPQSIEDTGVWAIFEDKIVVTFKGISTRNESHRYTLRGDRLTFFYDDGSTEIWERRK